MGTLETTLYEQVVIAYCAMMDGAETPVYLEYRRHWIELRPIDSSLYVTGNGGKIGWINMSRDIPGVVKAIVASVASIKG